MKCTNCGFETADQTGNCPNCNFLLSKTETTGEGMEQFPVPKQQLMPEQPSGKIEEQNKCLSCGNILLFDDDFCIKCGTKKINLANLLMDPNSLEQVLNAKENELNFLKNKLYELNNLLLQKPKKGSTIKILSLIFNGLFIIVIAVMIVAGITFSHDYTNTISELAKAQDSLNNYVSDLPITATYIVLNNTDKDGNIINSDQETYNYADIRYMQVGFLLTKLDSKYDFGGKKVYVKFIDPYGDVMSYKSDTKSTKGYTDVVDITEDNGCYVSIGNGSEGTFDAGTYFVGIYFEGRLIGSTHFFVR
jgi:hypothetical protein